MILKHLIVFGRVESSSLAHLFPRHRQWQGWAAFLSRQREHKNTPHTQVHSWLHGWTESDTLTLTGAQAAPAASPDFPPLAWESCVPLTHPQSWQFLWAAVVTQPRGLSLKKPSSAPLLGEAFLCSSACHLFVTTSVQIQHPHTRTPALAARQAGAGTGSHSLRSPNPQILIISDQIMWKKNLTNSLNCFCLSLAKTQWVNVHCSPFTLC